VHDEEAVNEVEGNEFFQEVKVSALATCEMESRSEGLVIDDDLLHY
jgi:hypothetical protein